MDTRRRADHPSASDLAEYLGGTLPPDRRSRVAAHIASCPDCLAAVAAAHEAVSRPAEGSGPRARKRRGWSGLYLAGALGAFVLSFLLPRYFVQFLVATVILALKWIIDAKSTRTLIAVHDALKDDARRDTSPSLRGPLDRTRKTP